SLTADLDRCHGLKRAGSGNGVAQTATFDARRHIGRRAGLVAPKVKAGQRDRSQGHAANDELLPAAEQLFPAEIDSAGYAPDAHTAAGNRNGKTLFNCLTRHYLHLRSFNFSTTCVPIS